MKDKNIKSKLVNINQSIITLITHSLVPNVTYNDNSYVNKDCYILLIEYFEPTSNMQLYINKKYMINKSSNTSSKRLEALLIN